MTWFRKCPTRKLCPTGQHLGLQPKWRTPRPAMTWNTHHSSPPRRPAYLLPCSSMLRFWVLYSGLQCLGLVWFGFGLGFGFGLATVWLWALAFGFFSPCKFPCWASWPSSLWERFLLPACKAWPMDESYQECRTNQDEAHLEYVFNLHVKVCIRLYQVLIVFVFCGCCGHWICKEWSDSRRNSEWQVLTLSHSQRLRSQWGWFVWDPTSSHPPPGSLPLQGTQSHLKRMLTLLDSFGSLVSLQVT